MRGLKLNDEVIYYRKVNGETGEGYIQSIKETSKYISEPRFEISIGVTDGIISRISYVEENDSFVELGGEEIQIIKKTIRTL